MQFGLSFFYSTSTKALDTGYLVNAAPPTILAGSLDVHMIWM